MKEKHVPTEQMIKEANEIQLAAMIRNAHEISELELIVRTITKGSRRNFIVLLIGIISTEISGHEHIHTILPESEKADNQKTIDALRRLQTEVIEAAEKAVTTPYAYPNDGRPKVSFSPDEHLDYRS